MNVQTKFFLVMAVLVGALQGCQDSAPEPSAEHETRQSVDAVSEPVIDLGTGRAERMLAEYTETFEAAWAKGDAATLAQLYAEDAVQVLSSLQLPVYGRGEIQAALAASFADNGAGSRISTTTEVAKFLSADILMGSGTYETTSSSGEVLRAGMWSNVWRVEDGDLKMLLESAGEYALNGMDEASASVPQVMAPRYTGAGADLLDQGVSAYVEHTNAGNLKGVADLFMANGLQAVSQSGRIVQGRENILAAMSEAPARNDTTLSGWGYGYRPIGGDLAIGWGGFQHTSQAGEVVEYGLWGNIWVVTDKGLMLISERAGSYSGG